MNDDWRLQVEPQDPGLTGPFLERLEGVELAHDVGTAFSDRVIVSRDGPTVFLYAGDRPRIEAVRRAVLDLAERHGWKLDVELRRWHPVAEEWEDPDTPLPETDADRAGERESLMERERRESEASGYPEYEVRVVMPSHREAAALAKRLREEGEPIAHRWRFVLVGAADEDSAKALAHRLRAEVPPDGKIAVEGTWREAYAEQPPNRFAFLGGLAG